LCVDILLGLPWLKRNKIVIDHELRTVINKETGFDLLSIPPKKLLPCLRPKKKLREQYEEIMNHRKELLQELNSVCASICENQVLEEVKFDIAGMVRTRIEHLSYLETLKENDVRIKQTFNDVFSPIPHVSELPTDVYCRIKLKDASKTITTRSYTSPRKYKESWDTLIQKHLDAGGSSPHLQNTLPWHF
jgi:hypothetical protein